MSFESLRLGPVIESTSDVDLIGLVRPASWCELNAPMRPETCWDINIPGELVLGHLAVLGYTVAQVGRDDVQVDEEVQGCVKGLKSESSTSWRERSRNHRRKKEG